MEKLRIERVSQLEPVLELNISSKEIISVYNPNGEKPYSANYLVSPNKELVKFLQLLIGAKGYHVSVNGKEILQISSIGYVFDITTSDEKDRVVIVMSKRLSLSYVAKSI